MPLQVPQQPALLPAPLPANIYTLVSPVENLVHGYNMVEQTCFHKTTVSNVIPGFSRLSAFVKGIDGLLQPVRALISSATNLVTDVTQAVGLTRAMLTATTTVFGAVTTVVGTVTTVVGTAITLLTTVIGLITSIISSLGGIATACLVAGILTIAAGALFGFGFVGVGGTALAAILVVVFFVVRGAVMTIATLLGTVTAALGPLNTALGTLSGPLGVLTGALGPLNTAIGRVNSILADPALPSDVERSLAAVSAALTDLQKALAPPTPGVPSFTSTLASTATTLDDRVKVLQEFLNPTTAKVPRTSLEDTSIEALRIYNAGLADTQASTAVWNAIIAISETDRQIRPNGVPDTTLPCPKQFREL